MPTRPRCGRATRRTLTRLNWQVLRLKGDSSHEYARQIDALGSVLDYGWATRPSESNGNPVYVRPSVLVIYREDHAFLLDAVIPRPETPAIDYDFILASQPWRARMSAQFKVGKVLLPLVHAPGPGRPAAGDPVARRRSGARDRARAVARGIAVPGGPAQTARGA